MIVTLNNENMFVRFTKTAGNPNRNYRRAVAINGTFLVQEANKILAYAELYNVSELETLIERVPHYRIWCLNCENKAEIERYIKRFIGNSCKWEGNTKYKRRRYSIVYVDDFDINHFGITWVTKKKK